MLTIDFSNFSAARTAIDLHTTATGYSALGISNVLIAVSVILLLKQQAQIPRIGRMQTACLCYRVEF